MAACKHGAKAVLAGARTYACDLYAAEIAQLLRGWAQAEVELEV